MLENHNENNKMLADNNNNNTSYVCLLNNRIRVSGYRQTHGHNIWEIDIDLIV